MAISLSPDATTQLLASIKQFTAEHLDEEVGDLKARLFLEFCLAEIGSVVYNQAIADAQRHLLGVVNDLDALCYQPESTYWKRPGGKGRS